MRTSSGNVVATSFLYLTVHRRIASDVPVYQKFALKVTQLSTTLTSLQSGVHALKTLEHEDFDRFRLIVPHPWELAKKVQLSLTGSRQCTFHRALVEPCALPLNPPKGGSKREFLHLALASISSLQVVADTSNLVCGSPSLQMTNRPWMWLLQACTEYRYRS